MTVAQALLAFLAAASVLTLTPGLDTAMVLRSAAAGGARQAAFAAAGIGLGCFVWGAAASIGLGALLAASTLAFTMLKWAGAAYLLYLGLKLILRPRDSFDVARDQTAKVAGWHSLRQGFLTNMLNPKVGVFYITFLPQFIPAGVSVVPFSLLLTGIQVFLGLVWFAVLVALTTPIGRLLRRPRAVKTMDRLTGGVFVAFGAKLALAR
ncbi:LysE family translocator [Altererythrobacter sp. Root672]|uniref:LysE family translocator n=1 Tax=Altererythrobacter sp. Root672 TaxID=1736584 RepID=UPI0006FB8B22|nr:LysE family translocator [Altererythrobacter sp. Root672]KRA79791.1 lysine transporter LysE [Altererythrobacter sp. Root672]